MAFGFLFLLVWFLFCCCFETGYYYVAWVGVELFVLLFSLLGDRITCYATKSRLTQKILSHWLYRLHLLWLPGTLNAWIHFRKSCSPWIVLGCILFCFAFIQLVNGGKVCLYFSFWEHCVKFKGSWQNNMYSDAALWGKQLWKFLCLSSIGLRWEPSISFWEQVHIVFWNKYTNIQHAFWS